MIRSLFKLKNFYHQVKTLEQFKKVASKSKACVINFHAIWCGPCKVMSPILIKKQKQAKGEWDLIRVDIDLQGNSQLCQMNQLQGVPTVIFMKDGKQVQKFVGGRPQVQIDKALAKLK